MGIITEVDTFDKKEDLSESMKSRRNFIVKVFELTATMGFGHESR